MPLDTYLKGLPFLGHVQCMHLHIYENATLPASLLHLDPTTSETVAEEIDEDEVWNLADGLGDLAGEEIARQVHSLQALHVQHVRTYC